MPLDEHSAFACPYCGAENSLEVDVTGGRRQNFVVDCEVCCAPIIVRLTLDSSGAVASLDVRKENE
ncbi:MAG: hypothetical protein A2787_05120 [Omnitrophica WOR_2 bacterium RIFCSPHIGHO2_01_FULL_48_9]|nr:MAG: hypothetical protein A3D10_01605 [Omnitrophica WOR_2 bacterium RIFCSPHIGHO2_02_FULL_48_11]OGX33996.1 MAG: hypothetical protein A2787_05120 [Omnitrophica WOR_2 bacterium RIFCSPHIGHO2_01_FULL_48_9]